MPSNVWSRASAVPIDGATKALIVTGQTLGLISYPVELRMRAIGSNHTVPPAAGLLRR